MIREEGSEVSAAIRSLVVVHPSERVQDFDHGFVRGWGVSGSLSGSRHLSMAYGVLPPGIKAKAHRHPFETAIYIISGGVRVYYGGALESFVDIMAGDFIYIPADLPHGPENMGKLPMEYIVARDASEEIGEELEEEVS